MRSKAGVEKTWCYSANQLLSLYHPNSSAAFLAEEFGVSRTTIVGWRNQNRKLTVWQADKYAVRIGRHPAEIWTDWYDKQ